MDLNFICMDLYNLFVPLWFFQSFIPSYLRCSLVPYLTHAIYLQLLLNFCYWRVVGFLPFSTAPEGCACLYQEMVLFALFYTLHYLTNIPICSFSWLSLIQWERQLSFHPLCYDSALYQFMNSWNQIYISAISNNSSLSAGNNFIMSFAEWLHPLSQAKNTISICASTLHKCLSHHLWIKWFLIFRLYVYCSSSFYIHAEYWTILPLTASWILHNVLSLARNRNCLLL